MKLLVGLDYSVTVRIEGNDSAMEEFDLSVTL